MKQVTKSEAKSMQALKIINPKTELVYAKTKRYRFVSDYAYAKYMRSLKVVKT